MHSILLIATLILQVVIPETAGTISGRLLTPLGSPIAGVRVAAAVADPAAGDSTLTFASLALTDADGKYTLENVPPGKYVIAAGRATAPVYYPNGLRLDATVISVGAGARIAGIDFKSDLRGEAIASGTPSVVASRNVVVAGISLPSTQEPQLRGDSGVKFANPVPGIYAITAPMASLLSRSLSTWLVDNFAVEIPIKEVIGRVELESGLRPSPFSLNVLGLFGMNRRGTSSDTLMELNRLPESLRRSLFSDWGMLDPDMLQVEVTPSAREAFRFLIPEGAYGVLTTLPSGGAGDVYVKSAVYGTTNLLTSPLVISKTDRAELRIVLGVRN